MAQRPNSSQKTINNYPPLSLAQSDALAASRGRLLSVSADVVLSGTAVLLSPAVQWDGGSITCGSNNITFPGTYDVPETALGVFDTTGTGLISVGLAPRFSPWNFLPSLVSGSTECATAIQRVLDVGANSPLLQLAASIPMATYKCSTGVSAIWTNVSASSLSIVGAGSGSNIQSNITNGAPLIYIGNGSSGSDDVVLDNFQASSLYDGSNSVNELALLHLDFQRRSKINRIKLTGGKNTQLLVGRGQNVSILQPDFNGSALVQNCVTVGYTAQKVTFVHTSGSDFAVGNTVVGATSTATGIIELIVGSVMYVYLTANTPQFQAAEAISVVATGAAGTVSSIVASTGGGNGFSISGAGGRISNALFRGINITASAGSEGIVEGQTLESCGSGFLSVANAGACYYIGADRYQSAFNHYENRRGHHIHLNGAGHFICEGDTMSGIATTRGGYYCIYITSAADCWFRDLSIITESSAERPPTGLICPHVYVDAAINGAPIKFFGGSMSSIRQRFEFGSGFVDAGNIVVQDMHNENIPAGSVSAVSGATLNVRAIVPSGGADFAVGHVVNGAGGGSGTIATYTGPILFVGGADGFGGSPSTFTVGRTIRQTNGVHVGSTAVIAAITNSTYLQLSGMTGTFDKGALIVDTIDPTLTACITALMAGMTLSGVNITPFVSQETITDATSGATASIATLDQAILPCVLGVVELLSNNSVATTVQKFAHPYPGQTMPYKAMDDNTTISQNTNHIHTLTAANMAMKNGDVAFIRFDHKDTPSGFELTGRMYAYQLAVGGMWGATQGSVLATQFDQTSSTTLAAITGLSATLAAGRKYTFKARLFTTGGSNGRVKVAIGGTATATQVDYQAYYVDGTAPPAIPVSSRATALATAVSLTATASTASWVEITGSIIVNATGTLTPTFAQDASNVTASSVLVGSTWEVTHAG